MASWEDFVGNYAALKVPKAQNTLGICIHKTALFVRKQLTLQAQEVDPDFKDPHEKSLSFDEETMIENYEGEDKKNKPKPKYTAMVSTQEEYKDAEGKTKKRVIKGASKKEAEKPKAKWFTATADFKFSISFMLQRYVKEINDFYVSKGKRFPEETTVLSEFQSFTSQPMDIGQFNIAPFIIGITDKLNASKQVEAIYGQLDQFLFTKLSDMFKDVNGATPSHQINKLVDRFVQFIKLIAIFMARMLWSKKLRVDAGIVETCLRCMEVFGNKEIPLDESFFKTLTDYNAEMTRIQEGQKADRKVKSEAAKVAKANTPGEPEALTGEGEDVSAALDAEEETWDEAAPTED